MANLPTEPAAPVVVTDQSIGQWIVDLRSYGRMVAARFEALRAWAIGKP